MFPTLGLVPCQFDGANILSKQFESSADYFGEVAQTTSKGLCWKSIQIYQCTERSNDVSFGKGGKNTLTLDLTGTLRHLTEMDGIIEDRATAPGEICAVPAGLSARFAWEVNGESQRSIMVEFDQELFKRFCPEIASDSFIGGHLLPSNYAPAPTLASLISVLSRELEESGSRGLLFAETAKRLFALEVAAAKWSRIPSPLQAGGSFDRRVHRAIEFVESNFRSNISLLQLTAASGLSTTRLIHLFRQTTGHTPYAYVVHRRIRHAVYLLKNTDMPISHIAVDVGFSDQQHMTHQFRRHMRRTPLSYKTEK
jgi:AraC family transcriptional regulator